jgi:hypothetical protein
VATLNEIERKLMVCLACKCERCPILSREIPEDCKYILKHALAKEDEGIVINRPRRSGKTDDIMKMAMKVTKRGYDAVVMMRYTNERYELQRAYMGTGISFWSIPAKRQDFQNNSVRNNMHGLDRERTLFFSDNLPEWVADEIKDLGYRFIIGFQ